MAGTDRTAPDSVSLLESLEREPYRHDFFQVVRRLECAFAGSPRFGRSKVPGDDPIRFGQEPSLAFAPSTIAAFRRDAPRPQLKVLFWGMFGPNGALPLHLTQYARERIRDHEDHTFAAFVDMFHHRMISLFYRAWAAAQPTANFDRRHDDRFALYLGSLVGRGTPGMGHRDAMPDLSKLHFAGLLGALTRNRQGLELILARFFEMPVEVHPFAGRWVEIPDECRLKLGLSPDTGRLGINTTIGARIWNAELAFRVVVGPLRIDQYERLLPGQPSFERLASIVRNYDGLEHEFEVQLVLRKEDVPELHLGKAGQLGWTTWLKSKPPLEDAKDLVLSGFDGEI